VPDVDVFGALANPVRRQVLEALRDGPLAAGELAGRFELSRPAVSEHLAVLRHAGLITEEPRGRHRYYHLAADPLAEVYDWLHPFERYWRSRLGALRDFAESADFAPEKAGSAREKGAPAPEKAALAPEKSEEEPL
jgi:DNA-binding transcriptional ArsR family regulator